MLKFHFIVVFCHIYPSAYIVNLNFGYGHFIATDVMMLRQSYCYSAVLTHTALVGCCKNLVLSECHLGIVSNLKTEEDN